MATPDWQTKPTEVHQRLGEWILADGLPVVYDPRKSSGATLFDSRTDKPFLDLFSFFASMPVGHNHPGLADEGFRAKLLSAALVKPSNSDIYTQAMADFAVTFGRTLPKAFTNTFFIEGGALGVENALKVAFDWKVQKNIERGLAKGDDPQFGTKVVHFTGAFHGRTGYTLSLTNTSVPNKTKYFPKFDWPRVESPGIRFPLDAGNLKRVQAAEQKALAAIKAEVKREPHAIGAMIIETVQGEGGDVHFRDEFLGALRRICDDEEIILVFDEVQAGLGITGRWWAFEHQGMAPDIFCFGKKTQVCGLASTDRVNDVESCFKVSSRINSTWGGSLVDMVRCTRYIELIEQHDLLANAAAVGEYLLGRLRDLEGKFEPVQNTRGRGLMCAMDLPTPELRDRTQALIYEHGAIMLPCGTQTLRFRPSLDFTTADVDKAMDIIATAVGKL